MTDASLVADFVRKVVERFVGPGESSTADIGKPGEDGQCFPYAGGDLTFDLEGTFTMPFGSTADIRVYRTDAGGDETNVGAVLIPTATGISVRVPGGQLTEVVGSHCAVLRISIRAYNPRASIPYVPAGSRVITVCRNCGNGTGGGTMGTGSGTATGTATGTASGTGSSTTHGPLFTSATGEGYGEGSPPAKKGKKGK